MRLSEINNSVETLGGIGPATTKQFARLNIFTISDLLQTFPRSYDDRTKTVTLNKYAAGLGKVHTICKVTSHAWFGYGRMKTLKLAITDGTANAWLIAFNRPFLEKALPEGSIVAVTGDFSVRYNELQSSSFEAERISYDGELSEYKDAAISNSGVIPVYPLTEGLSQKNFHKAISLALKQYGKAIDDELPATIIQERHLLKKSQALFFIHEPKSLSETTDARRTFIYEELYNFEYTMALRTFEHRGSLPTVTQAAVFDTPLQNDAKLSSSAQTSALQPQATVGQTNASSA
ncbi:MAG: ATP-dependent DNA helicase RecG, partial [Treponema sp.]